MPAKDLREMAVGNRKDALDAFKGASKKHGALKGTDKRFAKVLSEGIISNLGAAVRSSDAAVLVAFMNDTTFELTHGRRKRVVRVVRFPTVTGCRTAISVWICSRHRLVSADPPRPVGRYFAKSYGANSSAIFDIPEFGKVTFSVPMTESGNVDIAGDVEIDIESVN